MKSMGWQVLFLVHTFGHVHLLLRDNGLCLGQSGLHLMRIGFQGLHLSLQLLFALAT